MNDILTKLEKIQVLIRKNPDGFKETDSNVIYTLLESSDYETVINNIRKNIVPYEDNDHVPDTTSPRAVKSAPSPVFRNRKACRISAAEVVSDSEDEIILEDASFQDSSINDSLLAEVLDDVEANATSPIITSNNRKRKRNSDLSPSPSMQQNQTSDALLSSLLSIFPDEQPHYLKLQIKENPGVSADDLVTIILDAKSRYKKNGGIGKKSSSKFKKPNKEHSVIELSDTDDEALLQEAVERVAPQVVNKEPESAPKKNSNDNPQFATTSINRNGSKSLPPCNLSSSDLGQSPRVKRKPPEIEDLDGDHVRQTNGFHAPVSRSILKKTVDQEARVPVVESDQQVASGLQQPDQPVPSSSSHQNATSVGSEKSKSAQPATSSQKKADEDMANVTIDLGHELDNQTRQNGDDTTLSNLLGIFPDVDPSFLEKKAEEIGDDAQRLEEFILNNVGTSNLPSRKEYDKKMARKNEIQKIKNLKVVDFLMEFENPGETFYDSKPAVSEAYKKCCLSYLERKFAHVAKRTFDKIVKKHNYHLLPSLKDLEKVKSRSRVPRAPDANTVITSENLDIAFFKEYIFLKLEPKIKQVMAENEHIRQQKVEEARENGALFTCQCCFDDECLLGEECTCLQDHMFCTDCVRRGAEVQIGENKTKITCFEQDCGMEIGLTVLQRVLRPKIYQRLTERRAAEDVLNANVENLVQCPACNFAVIIPESEKLIKCGNPECGKVSCKECKEENHLPLRCDENEKQDEVKARTKLENVMAEAIIRECPKCKNRFLKSDGCNKMKCQCGTVLCYLCKKVIPDNYNHFYGHGATPARDKCPLWSDNDSLHKSEVAKAAEATKAEMDATKLKNDPTVGMERPPQGYDRNRQHVPGMMGAHHNPHHHQRMRFIMNHGPAVPPIPPMPPIQPPPHVIFGGHPRPAPPFVPGFHPFGGQHFDRRFNRNMGNFGRQMNGRVMDFVFEDMGGWMGAMQFQHNNRLH